MSGYAFIYTSSRLKKKPPKWTPYVDLYDAHLQLNQDNINEP